jgi:hypothetical protein
MFYPDLSPYEQNLSQPNHVTRNSTSAKITTVLNIGWLDRNHLYPTGDIPDKFLDCLFDLCWHPVNLTRGFHVCELCAIAPHRIIKKKKNGVEYEFKDPIPISVQRNGKQVNLGNGEIRVLGKGGILYVAPTLIYHYVAEHKYRPPDAFIDAVINSSFR